MVLRKMSCFLRIVSPFSDPDLSSMSMVWWRRNCRFKAQVANKWVVGRTMVAGDAAHNFPPFGGQGIASGFRDAISLAWRLELVTKNPSIDYEQLLTGWYVERKQQVEVCIILDRGDLVDYSIIEHGVQWKLGLSEELLLEYFKEFRRQKSRFNSSCPKILGDGPKRDYDAIQVRFISCILKPYW